ncbi:hypothetical protein OEZ85_002217 [Tetradesmus obliquus]|uniref:Uncharacterized protein n=1 Tax=Tetradesmus obliquus TaxID=3088 RepID=A0ABY8U304_TETOB|nr:hypothetical protein OEZ85_002217 [Tetradesmus obliquus]
MISSQWRRGQSLKQLVSPRQPRSRGARVGSTASWTEATVRLAAACSLVPADPAGAQEQLEEQQDRVAAALDVCIQCHLAVEDIVRLWTSSRTLQQLCRPQLSGELLVRSVAAAEAAAAAAAEADAFGDVGGGFDKCNSMKSLRWLLRQPDITAAVINQHSKQLLAIPGVPLAAAVALVRAGLRVQITGQQEWAADLPAELRRLCCCDTNNDDAESDADETSLSSLPPQLVHDLTPGRATDLLVVALNVAAHRHIK